MHLARAVLAVVVLAATLVTPVRAQNCAPFTDVLAADQFCSSIQWMFNRGVTFGCTANQYCPANFVRRDQMAAFMNRLTDSLFPLTCSSGQVMKWNGTAWACANDNAGSGGGTVTSVMAGTGLQGSPNPITGAGSLNIAPAYQLPQSCGSGQVPKSNGSGGWTCQNDSVGGSGTVTSITAGTGLSGGTITATGTIAADTSYLQRRVTATCAAGSSIRTINADGSVVCEADDSGGGTAAWALAGNAGTDEAINFVGTTDNKALVIRVNGARALRIEPSAISPNLIGGNPMNAVSPNVRGATIGGGGTAPGDTDPTFTLEGPNVVTDAYGTVGGGYNNRAGDNANSPVDRPFATVAGGAFNIASGTYAAIGGGGGNQAQDSYATVAGGEGNVAQGRHGSVGGGFQNTAKAFWSTVGGGANNVAGGATSLSGTYSTVGGGDHNTASGNSSTIGGGFDHLASGDNSTVGGGFNNEASGRNSTVGGGAGNTAPGLASTVPGGVGNRATGNYSVAMGLFATVNGSGSFLFVDGSGVPVTTNTPNEFVVVASGGIAMSTTANFSNLCRLSPGGGSWACSSDRRIKRDFAPVDTSTILHKVVALPITTWRFQTQPTEIRHMGPMAQDFRESFGLGTDDKTITQVDVNGVTLAAIQGLNAKLESLRTDKDAEIARLRAELAELRALTEQVASDLAAQSRDSVASR